MATITPRIVTVSVEVVTAPTPSTYQQSGAFVSLGGTSLTANTYQYLPTVSSLTSIIGSSGNYQELEHMNATFFGQGNAIGAYVLELGTQSSATAGITALQTWITANPSPWGPSMFYSYLLPATWDTSAAALNTMASGFSSPTSMVYFFVTTTQSTISAYTSTNKAIIATCPSPTAASSEFQAAALFYQWLSNAPSPANPAAPMAFRFVYGVTPWPLTGYVTTVNNILTAYGNIIQQAAQGNISTACVFRGTTIDGNQAMFWYGVDWAQLQVQQQISATLIQATNSNAPIYYNQAGINTLQNVAQAIVNSGISNGLLLSPATINAIPFSVYIAANPSNYAAGVYNGFSGSFTPQVGFETIEFPLTATQVA